MCLGVPALMPSSSSALKYKAKLLASCCASETIESGATEREFFTLLNEGTDAWGVAGGPTVSLATDDPRAPSVLAAADWPSEDRALEGVLSPVLPGTSYEFAFDVKGPPVSSPTSITQHFGLLIGEKEWVDAGPKGEAKDPQGPDLTLPLTIVPPQPPGISLSTNPQVVTAGRPFTVTAMATSVASVNRVTIEYGGHTVTSTVPRSPAIASDEQTRWAATESFVAVGTGVQNIIATAYDDAGLSTSTTVTITVHSPPGPPTVSKFTARFQAAGSGRPGSFRLLRIILEPTARGDTLVAICRGCHGRTRLGPVRIHSSTGVITSSDTIFTARSRLTLYVLGPGKEGRFDVYRINPVTRQVPLLSEGCTAVDTTTHVGC